MHRAHRKVSVAHHNDFKALVFRFHAHIARTQVIGGGFFNDTQRAVRLYNGICHIRKHKNILLPQLLKKVFYAHAQLLHVFLNDTPIFDDDDRLAAHDPELLPETLLVTIAQAERSTPFPVMLEAILLYFMYELMREAGLRVPKPLGSSVGIVGGLVIGETAVSAGLVSAPSLVVIAVTVITGYTVPKLYEPMAVLRLIFILVGGIWGVWGVLAGFTFLLFELCGKTSFSVPFLAPVAPFRLSAMRDVLVRAGWKRLVRHNASVQHMPGAGKGEKHL